MVHINITYAEQKKYECRGYVDTYSNAIVPNCTWYVFGPLQPLNCVMNHCVYP